MKRSLVTLAILALSATSAPASPGDPRVLQGTLEWPATVTNEPFVVLRGEDGRMYYADISVAQRRTPEAMRSGSRLAVLGVEGARPYEIAAIAVGSGDASSLGLAPTSSPSSPSLSTPSMVPAAALAAPAPPDPMWRLDGTVQAVTGTSVSLRTTSGRAVSVDLSQLNDKTLKALQPGDRVTLFGEPRTDHKLVANGFLQSETGSPAASPAFPR
jgi:hypothetical protein